MVILELIAEYDSFLSKHTKNNGNCGKGNTNYLLSTIREEIVELIGKKVFNEIITRIKKSMYYSISLDSTPDAGHVDQLTSISRYLEDYNPVEKFVTYMPNQSFKEYEIKLGALDVCDEYESSSAGS